MMSCIDCSFAAPEDNLALDEALLELAEADGRSSFLRFWEPRSAFVVLGYANSAATEVRLEQCARDRIPVLRRITGGGTVVQMPGCLNYSLVMPINEHSPTASLHGTTVMVMQRMRDVVAAAMPGSTVELQGDSDLVVDRRKVSGNCQRRGTRALLFHGVFLLQADLRLITRLLPMPSRAPAYRSDRPHDEFLRNLGVSPDSLRSAIAAAWDANAGDAPRPFARVGELVSSRYSQSSWNMRR